MLKAFLSFLGLINEPVNNRIEKQAENMEQTTALSFPIYSPEEYQKEKKERIDKAINGCEFFEPLNIDNFEKNLAYFKDKKCPYCSAELPERKGKSYKCPNCNNKVYRIKVVASKFEGLYTEDEKQKQSEISEELSQRKKFLKVYENSCGLINFGFDEDKQQNIKRVMLMLHEARPYLKNAKDVDNLRMCRFREAEAQELYGFPSEALNAWLSVAYIDLWGNYNYLHEHKDDYQNTFTERDEEFFNIVKQGYEEKGMKYMWSSFEEYKQNEIEKYNKSRLLFDTERGFVAPFVLEKIFKQDISLENLQSLFEYNAKELSKRIQYTPPITPQEAWEKIMEYKQKVEV